ncbi:MAG: UDP-N-acetylmuramoyl-L-alanyl-D-glutamate--2,6-diaminopimelate ligase [Planctomycetes bacterium]|jgi:UDP-N-acetylmuramoyl-L-alanyl-D-glutamate--2,6-diaminopimelate ligase|nr:UDP-N-acetylmuramoyl-L-alanyl-D-glutamate--2,6-diaminopimelate ligase [Planctomycetota bacterium]MDP6409190.1 UDP-N-acetylmuramoyl-L-alanyl-D-glutamate--2,6-diaminopimelate ligase [Planctomycetota bacterium]
MLAELVGIFGGECELGAGGGPWVGGIQLDSRRIERGDLFAALAGLREDGARHVPDALARGASAVLAPRLFDVAAPLWVHPAARALVGSVAARLRGEPARGMFVVGVTGTNGKTTVAHLTGELLAHAGRRPAVLGTTGHSLWGGERVESSHTTPDAPLLWELIERHRARDGDALVLEVSSHALEQERTAGLPLSVAVFTNLSRDHLDYHGDMERYACAKARLFEGLREGGTAVIHAGDPRAEEMSTAAREAGARVVTYGVLDGTPENSAGVVDLRADLDRVDMEGSDLTLNGMGISGVAVRLPLLGRHNVQNALASAASALLSGASPSTVVEGLAGLSAPPGRMECVPTGERGIQLFVDYAHTEAALGSALGVLRDAMAGRAAPEAAGEGRLILLFGCGGERDRGKRAPMGRAACAGADVVILTSDNPRGENPRAIADEVRAGMDPARARVHVELDRRRAIRLALEEARPADVVLLAGKGHETVQLCGTERLPFDDRRVALEELG